MFTESFILGSKIEDFSDKLYGFNQFDSLQDSVNNKINTSIISSTVGIYKLNNNNFRCDNFIENHNKKHVLFSGCSNTFGMGLKIEETWANKTYQKIKNESECSGYFNIGVPGNNIYNSILNIFKYCKYYGNPDIVFINLPEITRFFLFDEIDLKYKLTYYKKIDPLLYVNKLIIYNSYLMLEEYCKSNNIKLFSFTYDCLNKNFFECTNEIFKNFNFNTFYYINYNKMLEELFLLKQDNEVKYFDIARDRGHPGTGWNIWWSNFIYNKYLESKQ